MTKKKIKFALIYLILVVDTTLVDTLVFEITYRYVGIMCATSLAWFFAVLFAYITNSKLAFHNKMGLNQFGIFCSSRFITFLLSLVIMWFIPSWLNPTIYKVFCSFVLMGINFITTKLILH